jgi:pSer/pThr/pTyr-binding forkhead associated (FHA) protein
MFKLVVSLRDRTLSRSEFDQETVRIGRASDNDVFIDNPVFSRIHAVIRQEGVLYVLEDADSVNGTYVNGKKVKTWNLSSGDKIQVGKFTLAFTCDAPRIDLPEGEHQLLDGGGTIAIQMKEVDLSSPEQRAAVRAHLLVPERNLTLRIEQDVFVVGGAATCDLSLGFWKPARSAMIVRGLGGFSVVNVSGRSLEVNSTHVPWRTWLRNDDRIDFDGLGARFRVGAPGEAPGGAA